MECIDVFISIGSNISNPKKNIDNAIEKLKAYSFFTDFKISSYYITSPVGYKNQPDFINCAVWFKTSTDLPSVYEITKNIEKEIGTFKTHKNGPRKIDLDIILYGQEVYDSKTLTIPHSKMHKRKFVLVPIEELNGDFFHPLLNKTIKELLEKVNKESDDYINKMS